MIVVGLTGGIASGKTTITNYIKKKNIPIHDSDAFVGKLYKKPTDSFLKYLKKIKLGHTLSRRTIDKLVIRDEIFNDLRKKQFLEKYIHSLVGTSRKLFLKKQKKIKAKIVFLDIPLLFEKKLDRVCDYVVLVYAPLHIRKQRSMKRKGMNKGILNKIINSQISDFSKKNKADFVINTSKNKIDSFKKISKIIKLIKNK